MDDKLHPTVLHTNVPSVRMGEQLMGLRYDLLYDVLLGMATECRRQALGDAERGRPRLSEQLDMVASMLEAARGNLRGVLWICDPYIRHEKEIWESQQGLQLKARGWSDEPGTPGERKNFRGENLQGH